MPGKHFPSLQPSEQRNEYWGEAAEYAERHTFERHTKAWGAAHKVGCKMAAAANVESVFSGSGKFCEEAPGVGLPSFRE